MSQDGKGWFTPVRRHPLTRVILYYLVLGGGTFVFWKLFPAGIRFVSEKAPGQESFLDTLSKAGPSALLAASETTAFQPGIAITAALAMSAAALVALPVAWVYIMTRSTKGYQQSVVQTLIILPIVVAGVMVLVKNSLALAFSLGGIVAAVRFRNTLDDSKDAVYIFLATGIGLAAGVQLTVAVTLSVLFNIVILLLWYNDFGYTPAPLEGDRAQRRLDRALAIANRTGMFVARLDEEIFKSMSPDQLDALADRAWRRRKKLAGTDEHGKPKTEERKMARRAEDRRPDYPLLLRIRTMDPDAVRAGIAPVLESHLARWRFGGIIHEQDGSHVVEYGVELKDGGASHAFLDSVRDTASPHVMATELK